MKKAIITSFFALIIASCAPLVKKERCQLYFKKIVKTSLESKPVFIRGNIFVHGAYLIFYGKFDENSSIVVKSPFGRKLFSVDYLKDSVCVKFSGQEKICSKNLSMYWDYLNIKLPFDLKQILTGKFKIDKNASFSCSEKGITVINKGVRIFYVGDRPTRVEYNKFILLYSYDNGKIEKITIQEKSKELLRIYIRETRKL